MIRADIHCHPTLKPYSRSFPERVHSPRTSDKSSIWRYDPQSFLDKAVNKLAGLTKFSQTSFSTLAYGGVNLIVASLYPLEKGFVRTRQGTGDVLDTGLALATGLGRDRINFLQDKKNGYFDDAIREYAYLQAMDGKQVVLDGRPAVYKLVRSAADITPLAVAANPADVRQPFVVHVLLSFEGAHVFYDRFDDIPLTAVEPSAAAQARVLANVDTVKAWAHRPIFITVAHHFYNGMCGHARSLTDKFIQPLTDQSVGLDAPLHAFGAKVIRRLLDDTKGQRILIDIKHMSSVTRTAYFAMLDAEYAAEKIPIVASHAAVRGNATNRSLFLDEDINFSDAEIIRVGASAGLFGLQLDERRIGSATEIRNFRRYTSRRKVLYHAAELVWRQIQHVVEVLDAAGHFAWSIPCIGSDYDGIVNPLDGVWTAEDFDDLEAYLLMHAHNYAKSDNFKRLVNSYNRSVDAEEIVSRFMGENVHDFVCRNF